MIAAALMPLAVDITTLDPMAGNPRRGDVESVKRSYRRFGQRKPIVARRRNDGRGEVIAGNHQLLAARALGWEELAVVWVDDDDAAAHAFSLADNRTADLGTYDDADLLAMLQEVAVDADLLAATSFTTADMEKMMRPLPQGDAAIDPDLVNVWGVIVEVDTEDDQAVLLERLAGEGYRVRAMIA